MSLKLSYVCVEEKRVVSQYMWTSDVMFGRGVVPYHELLTTR